MFTDQRTASSRRVRNAPWRICAAVASSWLVANAAAAQQVPPEKPLGGQQAVNAAGPDRPHRRDHLANATARPVEPVVIGNLSDPVWKRLRLAYAVAQRRVRTRSDCSALFAGFGADGYALLTMARFAPATTEGNRDVCVRATAGTRLDTHTITLCPAFATMTANDAAIILIHEVLHHAGMSEKPVDPNGLTPQEIDRLVADRCGH